MGEAGRGEAGRGGRGELSVVLLGGSAEVEEEGREQSSGLFSHSAVKCFSSLVVVLCLCVCMYVHACV